MIFCVPVTKGGQVDPRWGRADRVAIAEVAAGKIVRWEEHEVGWGLLHDAGTEGSHHGRVARFLQDQRVDAVIADHMGPGMTLMLQRVGLPAHLGAAGDARELVLAMARRHPDA
jgi:predicted Fe-Mo cluster-binding NifX family protein